MTELERITNNYQERREITKDCAATGINIISMDNNSVLLRELSDLEKLISQSGKGEKAAFVKADGSDIFAQEALCIINGVMFHTYLTKEETRTAATDRESKNGTC